MSAFILVIDAGTTSTRAMLFWPDGRCDAARTQELTQQYPAPGRPAVQARTGLLLDPYFSGRQGTG